MTIYLDHNASAPLRPEVRVLMAEALAEPGNASGVHSFGRAARARVEKARAQIAALAGVLPQQVTFTSGATEANNTVIQPFRDQRVLISAIEHSSVMNVADNAEHIPVTKDGVIDEDAFLALLDKGEAPALICLMMVNNENGVIQPVGRLAKLAKKKHPGVYIHIDAVQAAGRMPIDFPALHADYMSLSAHKIGGPQGSGALITAPGAHPVKLMHGGTQEQRRRAGTENVAGIAGFGLAAELAQRDIESFQAMATWRDEMQRRVLEITPDALILGANAPRVSNTMSLSVPGVEMLTVLMALDLEGIAVSSGSACTSGVVKLSPTSIAMGLAEMGMTGIVRVSLSWNSTKEDTDRFVDAWAKVMARLRQEKIHA